MSGNGISLEGATGQSIWGSLLGNIQSFIPGFGLIGNLVGAAGLGGFLSERFGSSVPQWARPITDTLATIWNGLINFVRGFFAKEEMQADQGLRSQFQASPAARQAAEALGGTDAQRTTLTNDITEIVNRRIRRDTGFNMTVDAEYASTAAIQLTTEIRDRLIEAYKQHNPNWTQQTVAAFTPQATTIAGAISGTNGQDDATNINTNTAGGYLGALLQAQRAVAAEGDMQASMVQPITIPANIAELARANAPAGVTPAPEGGSPTSGNSGPAASPQAGR